MRLKWSLISLLVAVFSLSALAQDTPNIPTNIDSSHISDDAVNAVAEKLYCPVCENIPLDDCGTQACQDWRNEIRGMLASGMSEESIIDNFVVRFGDRVVGSPRDPLIAAISIVTPWVVAILGIITALYTVMRWQQTSKISQPVTAAKPPEKSKRDRYLEQIEQDLAG